MERRVIRRRVSGLGTRQKPPSGLEPVRRSETAADTWERALLSWLAAIFFSVRLLDE